MTAFRDTRRAALPALAVPALILLLAPGPGAAQTHGTTAQEPEPAVRVGATLFADYTVTQQPKRVDVDGNEFTPNAFNITRAYVNVTGTLSRLIGFRITPDITRETGSGSSLEGSYSYRLKYAYAQINLDQWLPQGSFARFGMQQTPWIDFIDGVYRYRFQGPLFEDREGFLSSADVGATIRYAFRGDYGDIHGGFYNGETYTEAEANDQKAFAVRATVRPIPRDGRLKGLRLTGFHDEDAYVRDAVRRRTIAAVTYEHPWVNTGLNVTFTADQTRRATRRLDGDGLSVWATPKTPKGWGWEGLLRFDRLVQDQASSSLRSERERTIVGIAYWFPHRGNVSSAVLLNHERVNHNDYVPARPHERRWSVHTLVNF